MIASIWGIKYAATAVLSSTLLQTNIVVFLKCVLCYMKASIQNISMFICVCVFSAMLQASQTGGQSQGGLWEGHWGGGRWGGLGGHPSLCRYIYISYSIRKNAVYTPSTSCQHITLCFMCSISMLCTHHQPFVCVGLYLCVFSVTTLCAHYQCSVWFLDVCMWLVYM